MQKTHCLANFSAVISRNIIFGLSFILFQFALGQVVNTNQSVLEKQLFWAFDSLMAPALGDSPEVLLRIGTLGSSKSGFLKNSFFKYCAENNIPVKRDTADHELTIEYFDVNIIYTERPGRLLGIDSEIERNVHFLLEGWFAGKTYKSFSISKENRDVINTEVINRAGQNQYAFLRGKFRSQSDWTKYIEPAVAVLSVSAVIYLLFSLRL